MLKVADQPLEKFRYERKFLVDQMDRHQICALIRLHPAMFVTTYPPRWVNNIYLDTPQLDNYLDNVNGAVDRRKVRLRWYHRLFDEPGPAVLEFKIKRGLVGKKQQYAFTPFKLGNEFNHKALQTFFENANLPPEVKFLLNGQVPVLINRYQRWYYATTDGRFRITVDSSMAFYHLGLLENNFRYHFKDMRNKVVELKYQKEDEITASRIANHLPFTVYKNSKYVYGMDCVYW